LEAYPRHDQYPHHILAWIVVVDTTRKHPIHPWIKNLFGRFSKKDKNKPSRESAMIDSCPAPSRSLRFICLEKA
jgi:hypothetical protein